MEDIKSACLSVGDRVRFEVGHFKGFGTIKSVDEIDGKYHLVNVNMTGYRYIPDCLVHPKYLHKIN